MTSRRRGSPVHRVAVLCTGNSCRSQMAEAFLRFLGEGRVRVVSAGTEPAAEIHPLARRVMAEVGLDLAGQYPKSYDRLQEESGIRTVITVCGGAAETCPSTWQEAARRVHWPIEDPAAFRGDEEATLAEFRRVRDELEARVHDWLSTLAVAG